MALDLVLNAHHEFSAIKPPQGTLPISPVLDLIFMTPAIQKVDKLGPVLRFPIEVHTAKPWTAPWELDDSRLFPGFADFSNL